MYDTFAFQSRIEQRKVWKAHLLAKLGQRVYSSADSSQMEEMRELGHAISGARAPPFRYCTQKHNST